MKKNKKYSDLALLKRVFIVTKPFHKTYAILFGLIVSTSLIGLTSPYFFGKTVDALSAKDINGAYLFISLSVITLGFYALFDFLQEKIEIKDINFTSRRFFALWSVKKILKLSLGQFRNEHSGYRQKIFNNGEGALNELMHIFVYSLLPVLITSFVAISALFIIDYRLGSIILVSVVTYLYVSYRINLSVIPGMKEMQELWGNNGKEHSEILRYLYLIKANVQEEKVVSQYNKSFLEIEKKGVLLWTKYIWKTFVRDVLVSLLARSAALVLGVYFTVQGILHPETLGTMTLGELVTFFAWSAMVFEGFNRLGKVQRMSVRLLSEVRKFFQVIDEKSTVLESSNPINPDKFEGKIEFKDIFFTYPESDKSEDLKKTKLPVLDNISFTIEAGETCAFVGKSGSGKSTMVSLLLRAFDPQKGEILIDGNDLRELGINNYLQKVGVVEQNVELFDRTVGENILFSINDPSNYPAPDLDQVVSDSGVGEFNDRLTDGMDTLIGEKGIQLSGGQRQRLGIARVLAKKPDILIFDEATSSLDSSTETLIRESMNKALEDKTGIIIAHRLATVKNADKIIVFELGKVVGIGKHQELIKKCKQYKELVTLQNLED